MASEILLVTLLALPHVLYAYIWFYPQQWRSLFIKKIDSVYCFAYTAGLLKIVQFSAAAYWYGVTSGWVLPQWGAIEPRQLLLGLAALLAGQALNLGAYRALKTKGIYYGTKLGYKVKWQTGFPFNVVAHPQYVGSALTVWAFPALLWNQPAADNTSLLLLAAYWTALYVVTALQEQYLEGGPDLSSPVVHREPLFDSPVLHHRHVKEEHEVKVKAEPVY